MVIKDCINNKIRYVVRSLIYSKNVKVFNKFNDNLLSYDSQSLHDCISESVERLMQNVDKKRRDKINDRYKTSR